MKRPPWTGERARLLAFTQRDIRLAGHELAPDVREEVRGGDGSTRRDRRAVQPAHRRRRRRARRLRGRSRRVCPTSTATASARDGDGGYRITMAYPDVVPFLEHGRRRDRREELDPLVQQPCRVDATGPLLAEAVAPARARSPSCSGSPSWAHHTMDEKMAHDPETVEAFYAGLVPELTSKAQGEIDVMAKLLASDTGDDQLQPWDWRYYDTELRKAEFGVDPHEVAAYFPSQQVLDGLLEVTGEAFGLEYERLEDVPVWHPDVLTFAIADQATGERIAVTHMDLHPREGKYSHAAAFDLVAGSPHGRRFVPHAGVVHRRQLHQADRRATVAAHPRRGRHVLPRVRPRPPPDADAGRDGALLGDQHGARLRRGAVADHGALVLAARGPRPLRLPPQHRRADPAGARRAARRRTRTSTSA